MNRSNPAYKLSLAQRIKLWLIPLLGGITGDNHLDLLRDAEERSYNSGYRNGELSGELRAKIKFAVLPLPFTQDQLRGREYGEFITPAGFGVKFGECMIPAPGEHGYEQRAYYVAREDLDGRPSEVDLRCHGVAKFGSPSDPMFNSDGQLVPVIVTVLR